MKIGQRAQNLLLMSASMIGSLIICEIALRLFTPFPINKTSNKIEDDDLGYRMTSKLADIDKWGFRNPSKTQGVLAAIGDSHTYGINVRSEEAWPAVLQIRSGIPTYNFGLAGYGIYTYHALIRGNVPGKYEGLLIALYPPNDFSERSHCHIDRGSRFWNREITRLSLRMPKCSGVTEVFKRIPIKDYIESETALGSALKQLVVDRVRAIGLKGLTDGFYQEVPNTKESVRLRRVRKHMRAMNMNRPEIRIIWKDFLKMLTDWSNMANEKKLLIGILIIPSKQRLLFEYAKQKGGGELLSKLKDPVQTEIELEARIIKQSRDLGIPVESAIGPMLEARELAIQKGIRLYPPRDGHPNALGYRAYARAALKLTYRICDEHADKPFCSRTFTRRVEVDQ